jgi:hypothetical protein
MEKKMTINAYLSRRDLMAAAAPGRRLPGAESVGERASRAIGEGRH